MQVSGLIRVRRFLRAMERIAPATRSSDPPRWHARLASLRPVLGDVVPRSACRGTGISHCGKSLPFGVFRVLLARGPTRGPRDSVEARKWSGDSLGVVVGCGVSAGTAPERFRSSEGCPEVVRVGFAVGSCQTLSGPARSSTSHAGERNPPSASE